MEVSQVLGGFPGIQEANVFGVALPYHDGRAGCAAVVLKQERASDFDWAGLAKHLKAKLPRYAIPVFIRVVAGQVGTMSTHNNKQNKVPLRQEGVDPSLLGTKVHGGKSDMVYWMPPKNDTFTLFRAEDWEAMNAQTVKI
jgi:acyl-CoA synthetase (AMP-forming)/AMP-acid ligase II